MKSSQVSIHRRRTFCRVEVLGPDVLELPARFPCGGSFLFWSCIWVERVNCGTLGLVVSEVLFGLGLL